jgi:hypothetical protein
MAEFIAELTSVQYPDISHVVFVEADTVREAIDLAFFTRNIATSWRLTDLICEDIYISPTLLPISGQWWVYHDARRIRR